MAVAKNCKPNNDSYERTSETDNLVDALSCFHLNKNVFESTLSIILCYKSNSNYILINSQ